MLRDDKDLLWDNIQKSVAQGFEPEAPAEGESKRPSLEQAVEFGVGVVGVDGADFSSGGGVGGQAAHQVVDDGGDAFAGRGGADRGGDSADASGPAEVAVEFAENGVERGGKVKGGHGCGSV